MKSPRKESTILRNKDELMSLKRAMTDIFYFVQFIYIIHPIRGKVRFDLYPFQKAVIWQFLTNQFNIVLKFRQAGITELIALYCLWLALYKENQNIVIISIKDKVAKKVLRRIKYMYKHLPSYLKVRVVNGVSHKLGTCVTPDTVIVGEKEDFELGKYIPYQVGTLNVEHLGLRVLTHKGTFERVIKTYNKGVLETWEIQDDFGNLLKCTPEHRLYTTKGWKSVRDVVKGNLDIITWDTSYFDGLESPETLKPKKEVIKETGYPGYLVSNMANGKVFSHIAVSKIKVLRKFENVICDMEVENAHSYITKSGFVSHNTTEMEFENGSMITSIPTTEDAGRSEAVSLLVIDEAAILRWASTIWAAAFPTLSCLGYKTPIFLETREEVKKGIFKPFIKQVEIGSICPKEKGVNDISHLGLRTLSHKGLWQNILFSQNKGKLETWEVKDCKGKTIKATPEHRFYTLKGWKTLREIIERNLHVIQVETGLDKLEIPPQTKKPKEQIIKPIKDFPNHYISNWGKVYRKNGDELVEIPGRPNKDGYLRVGLTNGTKRNTGRESNVNKNKTFQLAIAKLVYQTFIGPIPFGYQIDHINCNKIDNYITNLRILTPTENVSRSSKYNLMAVLNPILGNKLPNLDKRGRILFLRKKGYSYNHIAKKIYPEALQGSKFVKRIFEERGSRVYISRLKLLNTTFEDIYDIHVENDNSFISANNYINHNTGGAAIVNSCVTGDTEIMTKAGPLRIDKIAPKEFGRHGIDHLGLQVLTHTGSYKRILGAVNKGDLETWEIINDRGHTLKCTPDHKLLTINGWRSVRDIVKKGLRPIFYNLYNQEQPPVTVKPKEEVFKEIPGFPNYLVSNCGKVYINKNGKREEKEGRLNNWGYRTITLWNEGNKKKYQINRLVAQIFIGKIPDGYQVDHINCVKTDDYVTNLQIVSQKENSKRGAKYSNALVLGSGRQSGGWVDLRLTAFIKREYKKHKRLGTYNSQDLIISQCQDKFGITVNRVAITRIGSGTRSRKVYTSKIKVNRKYIDTIYDIAVEEDQSYLTLSQYVNHNTPYGIGNWFHQMWVDACSSGTQFNPIRLYWDMHPERDGTWYHNMKQILGPRRTAQEIDGDFLTSGNSVFDLLDIKAIEDSLSEYLPIKLGLNGNLRIYEAPKKGVKYFLGADIASGRARDYSAFSIMKRDGEEVVCFKGKLPIEQFAKLIFDTAGDYNNALCAPEANDIGIGVIKLLQEWNYPNLYYSIQIIKEKNKKKPKKAKIPGWVTSVKNRHAMIMELESDIRNDVVVIKDPFFVQEAYTFIYNEMNKPIAMGKDKVKGDQGDELYDQVYTDDAILAKSITNFIRKGLVNSIIVAPK